jgi:hypothetical protein
MDGKDVDDAVLCWKWDVVLAGSGISFMLCISMLQQRSLLTEGNGHRQQPRVLDREVVRCRHGISETIKSGLVIRRRFVRIWFLRDCRSDSLSKVRLGSIDL